MAWVAQEEEEECVCVCVCERERERERESESERERARARERESERERERECVCVCEIESTCESREGWVRESNNVRNVIGSIVNGRISVHVGNKRERANGYACEGE